MKAKKTEKVKNPKPENKKAISKIEEVKKEMAKYFKDNKLDPTKDYTKDKKHGPKIKEFIAILGVNRSKTKDSLAPEKHHSKKEDKKKKPNFDKSDSDIPKKAHKYDYPLVDGREMTADEKKKYRMKMRREEKEPSKKGAIPVDKAKAEKKKVKPAKEVKVIKEDSKEKKKKKVKKSNKND